MQKNALAVGFLIGFVLGVGVVATVAYPTEAGGG